MYSILSLTNRLSECLLAEVLWSMVAEPCWANALHSANPCSATRTGLRLSGLHCALQLDQAS